MGYLLTLKCLHNHDPNAAVAVFIFLLQPGSEAERALSLHRQAYMGRQKSKHLFHSGYLDTFKGLCHSLKYTLVKSVYKKITKKLGTSATEEVKCNTRYTNMM